MHPPSQHPPPVAATPRRSRKGRARRARTWHVSVFNWMAVPWERDWAELPQDAISFIFRKLDPVYDLLVGGAAAACRSWRHAARHDPGLWRCLEMRYLPDVLVRAALRLSAGQCEAFAAELLDSDSFLFLAEQAPLLKSLRLIKCFFVSKEVQKEIKRFPLLEELELSLCFAGTETLEIIAEACPRLKHFSLVKKDRYSYFEPDEDDGNAFAIAKMHGLRSLYFDGNKLTNKGLTAILNGCPHLEQLNVFECENVKMDDDLVVKCSRVNLDGPRYPLPYSPRSCCISPNYSYHEDYEDYREACYYYLGDHIDDDELAEHESVLDMKCMRRCRRLLPCHRPRPRERKSGRGRGLTWPERSPPPSPPASTSLSLGEGHPCRGRARGRWIWPSRSSPAIARLDLELHRPIARRRLLCLHPRRIELHHHHRKLFIEVSPAAKLAFISEELCIGCDICIKKCPFDAIEIINLPKDLEKDTTHRYGPNTFKLHRLPVPRPGQVLGLVGTNGIGKSTALKVLAGKLKPNLGRFKVCPVSLL